MNGDDFAREMMRLHDELAHTFFAHQVALLDRDYATALAGLTAYREQLLGHAADEESLILPRYHELGGDATDAPVRLFLGEHDKLRAFLADFVARVQALRSRPDDGALLELLDREATYKSLMLHHDRRERNALYPFLALRLSLAEQRAVLAARRWTGDR